MSEVSEVIEAERVYQLGLWAAQAYVPGARFTDYYSSATFNMGIGVTEWGARVIACAGSKDARDFADDVTAIPVLVRELGCILHGGFCEGYTDAFAWLLPRLQGGECYAGHSLGAPHAALMATLAARAGRAVSMLVMLESPRPGFSGFRDLVKRLVKSIHSFRNGPDWVPDLPPEILGWRHIAEQIDLNNRAPGAAIESHLSAPVLAGLQKWRHSQTAQAALAQHVAP